MFPCCNHCYQKYINEDKTLDEKLIKSLEDEDKRLVAKENEEVGMEMFKFKPITCKCPCHVKGLNVIH